MSIEELRVLTEEQKEQIKEQDVCKLIRAYCKQENIWGSGNTPSGNVLVSFGVKTKSKHCKYCKQVVEE